MNWFWYFFNLDVWRTLQWEPHHDWSMKNQTLLAERVNCWQPRLGNVRDIVKSFRKTCCRDSKPKEICSHSSCKTHPVLPLKKLRSSSESVGKKAGHARKPVVFREVSFTEPIPAFPAARHSPQRCDSIFGQRPSPSLPCVGTMVLRLRGSDAAITANDAATFYRLAGEGNTDAVEVRWKRRLRVYRNRAPPYPDFRLAVDKVWASPSHLFTDPSWFPSFALSACNQYAVTPSWPIQPIRNIFSCCLIPVQHEGLITRKLLGRCSQDYTCLVHLSMCPLSSIMCCIIGACTTDTLVPRPPSTYKFSACTRRF